MARAPSARRVSAPKSEKAPRTVALIEAIAQVFSRLIENFGWPGALLIIGWISVYLWGTDDQKHRIIEMYVLGTGIAGMWPMVVSSVVFVLVLLAQRSFYLRKIGVINEELAREGREKSALQAQLSGRDLQHARTRTPGGH